MDSIDFNWMSDVGLEWAVNFDSNVCLVDWTKYARAGYFHTVNHYLIPVADFIVQFIRYIEQSSEIRSRDLIFAGHSLGAHIAGLVGRQFRGELKMIIALDAAGPLFTRPFLKDSLDRLDHTDADYVIAIHSCDGLLGVNIPIGHQDFFLNDGRFPQPGCTFQAVISGEENDPVRCSHFRAVDYFKSSLTGKKCIGYQCRSLRDYQDGLCKTPYDYLGFHGRKLNGRFIIPATETKEC